jgi:tryptophan-rich sensory protein
VVTNHKVVESIRPEPGNRRTGLSSKFHMRFPCRERPKILPATTAFNIVWPAAACLGGR